MSENRKEHKGGSDPKGFDRIVREVFAPIYPVIAKQIQEKTKINNGICIDAGCGTGALGRAMAKISDCEIIFFDQSDKMLDLVKEYALQEKILHRSSFLEGDIHNIDLESNSVDLVISRGSSPFWDDWAKAYKEILRVLKKGGFASIGGGFGTKELKDSISATMSKENPNWKDSFKDRIKAEREALPEILKDLNLSFYEIIDDESGYWVFMRKAIN